MYAPQLSGLPISGTKRVVPQKPGHVLGFFDVILSVRFRGNRYPLWVKAVQKKDSPTNFRHRTARDRLHEAGPERSLRRRWF